MIRMIHARTAPGTYPKNEITARAIQHAIPTYGIADIALSSPEKYDIAVRTGSARPGGMTRGRRTHGNIDRIPNAEDTSSNDSQHGDDNSGLSFRDKPQELVDQR